MKIPREAQDAIEAALVSGQATEGPRCSCGGEIKPFKVDHYPVLLSGCLKCGKEHGPWHKVDIPILAIKSDEQKTPTPTDQPPLEDISEKEFMWQVINFATAHGWVYYHTYRSDRSEKGFPDLVLVRGCILFREIKTETGKVTKDQQAWIAYLAAAGGDVKVWRPSDWPEIQETLK